MFDHLVLHCLAPEEAFSRHMRQVGESLGSLFLGSIPKYQVPQWLEADVLIGRQHASIAKAGRGSGGLS